MPRGDGTGPRGTGPMTGRAGGYCAGGGGGWRNRFFATGLPGWARFEEKEALKFQADTLQAELDSIRKRLEKIGSAPEGADR